MQNARPPRSAQLVAQGAAGAEPRDLEYLSTHPDPALFAPDPAEVSSAAGRIVARAARHPEFAPILVALAGALRAADTAMDEAELSRLGI